MAIEALGRLFDASIGFAPVDMSSAAVTGKRVSLARADGVTIVLYKGAGGSSEDPVLTLQQHTASSAGTSSNLAIIDHWYAKSATTLAGTETWTRNTQAAAATLTLTGEAQKQGIYVIEVNAAQLSDGYAYVSLSVADVGSTAQIGAVLYLPRELRAQRKPANLTAALS